MLIYLIEALNEKDSCSAIKSWKSKIKHHPKIKKAVKEFIYRQGITSADFSSAIADFVNWLPSARAMHQDETVVLWLSVHGAKSRIGVKFDNGDEDSMYHVLSPLDVKMDKVILLQSICYGSLPTITFAMNKFKHGPMVAFGSILEVIIPKLHYAEIEIFKLLVDFPLPTKQQICNKIDEINHWGAKQVHGYEHYCRAWFWGDDRLRAECYPKPVNKRPRLVPTKIPKPGAGV